MNREWEWEWEIEKREMRSQRSYCFKNRLIFITPHDGQQRKEVEC